MKHLILRCSDKNRKSHGGFQWPESGPVEAPDWKPTKKHGNGLHGWLYGEGEVTSSLYFNTPEAIWQVVEVNGYIDLGDADTVKFHKGNVIFSGSRKEAVSIILEKYPDSACIGANKTDSNVRVGDLGTANTGEGGFAVAGRYGIAKAGDKGIAKAGDRGIAESGKYGTSKTGYYGTATAGDFGTAIAGDGGTAMAGKEGFATVGKLGIVTIGNLGIAIAGKYGLIILATEEGEKIPHMDIKPGIPYFNKNGTLIQERWS